MKPTQPVDSPRIRRHMLTLRRLWEFAPLPRGARVALLAVVVAALLADGVLAFVAPSRSPAAFIDVGVLLAISLFAWRPPLAASVLGIGGLAAIWSGAGGPYSLALAVVVGLVTRTCSRSLSVLYCLVAAGWTMAVELFGQGLVPGGAVGTAAVGLASGLVGSGVRATQSRERALAADLDRLTRDSAAAVQMERDRIADELHNIIAHDITIVVMHARALDIVDDPKMREVSTRAITKAATQALTDIRRMLQVVQPSQGAAQTPAPDEETLLERLSTIRDELSATGARVRLVVPNVLDISNSIEAALRHIANECSTNIIKHAPRTPAVHIALVTTSDTVTLTVWNAADPRAARRPGPVSGYGLKRMSDRVTLLGGSLLARPDESGWIVETRLPTN